MITNRKTITGVVRDRGSVSGAVRDRDGAEGDIRYTVLKGVKGDPGDDGVSPSVAVTEIEGGHRITIADAEGTHTFDVMDGGKGDPGNPGHSPVLTAERSGRTVTILCDGVSIATISDGQDGAPGYTPVRGTDYWTEADRQAIIEAVLDMYPAAEEVNF